jgi:hypothetical protein
VEVRLHTLNGNDFSETLTPTEDPPEDDQENISIEMITVTNASLGQVELQCKSLGDSDVIIEDTILKDSSGHAIEVLSLTVPVTLPASGSITEIECDFDTTLITENTYSIVLISENSYQFVSNQFTT